MARESKRWCDSCRAPLKWVLLRTGGRAPLDLEPLPDPLGHIEAHGVGGVVAFNPNTQRGLAMKTEHVADLPRWIEESDVAVHLNHYASCPDAASYRTPEPLPGGAALPCGHAVHREHWKAHPDTGLVICWRCHPPPIAITDESGGGILA